MIRLDILRFTSQQYRRRRKASLLLFLLCNVWLLALLLYLQKAVLYLFCLLGSSVALGARLRKLQRDRILVESLHARTGFGRSLRGSHRLDFEAGSDDETAEDRLQTERELAALPRMLDSALRAHSADSTSLADVQPARDRPGLPAPEDWENPQESARRLAGLTGQGRIRVHPYNRSPSTSSDWWSSTRGDWTGSWPAQTATLQASKKQTCWTSPSAASTR